MSKPFPHERITDPGYFQRVRENADWLPEAFRVFWFGIRGKGQFANYQVGWPPGHPQAHEVRRFRGRTHNPYHPAPLTSFNPKNLAGPYTWDEVCAMGGTVAA